MVAAGGQHEWYNVDNEVSACYHCLVEKEGKLWQGRVCQSSREPPPL